MKVCIVTINDMSNFGNRLQSYALFYYLKNKGFNVVVYNDNSKLYAIKSAIKRILIFSKQIRRFNNFYSFTKKYIACKSIKKFDDFYVIVGSDQVWNPTLGTYNDFFLLNNIYCKRKISYAASFGISELPVEYNTIYKSALSKFDNISVREKDGKNIIESIIKEINVSVLIDPTMLLSKDTWEGIMKKPKKLRGKKFILNYFLGDLTIGRRLEIERIAKENDCKIINLLDPKDLFYECGPEEFLYLEREAFLICTDSFHSSVFAFLFDKPFIVFERIDNKNKNMNSRIETFLNTFKISNRKYNEISITGENMNHDYSKSYNILRTEIKRSETFLLSSLCEGEKK